MGTEATRFQAEHLVSLLQKEGINILYGDSMLNDDIGSGGQVEFTNAFYRLLEQVLYRTE